jgi:hypothetical protein
MATTYQGKPVYPTPTRVGTNNPTTTFTNSVAFVINDVVQLFSIPSGATLTDILIDLPQLDTATSLVIDVGTDLTVAQGGVDIGSGKGFFSGSTSGRSATYNVIAPQTDTSYQHASLPFKYLAKLFGPGGGVMPRNCTLEMKVRTAAGTATTGGVITASIIYTMTDDFGSQEGASTTLSGNL